MARQQRELTPDDLPIRDQSSVDITNGQAGHEQERIALPDRAMNQSKKFLGKGIPSDEELAELAFMEEVVTIRMERPQLDTEKPVLAFGPFGVNGREQWIPADEPWPIKRKYLEVILRAQPFAVTTDVFKPGDRDERQVINRHASRRYSVSILHEPNQQRGAEWHRQVCLQG